MSSASNITSKIPSVSTFCLNCVQTSRWTNCSEDANDSTNSRSCITQSRLLTRWSTCTSTESFIEIWNWATSSSTKSWSSSSATSDWPQSSTSTARENEQFEGRRTTLLLRCSKAKMATRTKSTFGR